MIPQSRQVKNWGKKKKPSKCYKASYQTPKKFVVCYYESPKMICRVEGGAPKAF
jgi:hypothetical protein